MESIPEDIKDMITKCNLINENPDKGIGTDDDKVSDVNNYKYYKITPEFKLFDKSIFINIINLKLNEDGKTLVVLPGFSEKSICWTIGRIFRFKEAIKEKGFSNIYIFDFKNIKAVQDDVKEIIYSSQTSFNCFYNDVAHIVDKIIRGVILKDDKKISILGRSAGGGVALFLYQIKTCEYIEGLNLAAPGFDPNGLPKSLLLKAQESNLQVRLGYSITDKKVPKEEIDAMNNLFSKYINDNYKYIEINDIGNELEGHNHRIHKALIESLV